MIFGIAIKQKKKPNNHLFMRYIAAQVFAKNSHHKSGNVGNNLCMPWPKNAICCFMQKQMPKYKDFFS